MGKGADSGQAHGKLAIVGVGQPDASRFHHEPKFIGIGGPQRLGLARLALQQPGDVIARENGFVEMATGKPDT